MARYKEGESGNPAGRPVGSKNKVTPVTVDEVREFVNDNWEGIKRDFRKMEPADRVQCYLQLLRYVLPTPGKDTGE